RLLYRAHLLLPHHLLASGFHFLTFISCLSFSSISPLGFSPIFIFCCQGRRCASDGARDCCFHGARPAEIPALAAHFAVDRC
ncbi:hypothetical protein DFH09DRAFT_1168867, partial [Mycena vulgaris]